MTLSIFSFVMALLWSNIVILVLYALCKNNAFISRFGMTELFILMGGCLFRAAVPIELSVTHEIQISEVYPAVVLFFETSIFGTWFTVSHALISVWVLGIIIQTFRFFTAYFSALRKLERQKYAAEDSLVKLFRETKAKFGIHKDIGLTHSPRVKSPMLIGFRKPIVYLPEADYTGEEYECISRHELTRRKNRDNLLKLQ